MLDRNAWLPVLVFLTVGYVTSFLEDLGPIGEIVLADYSPYKQLVVDFFQFLLAAIAAQAVSGKDRTGLLLVVIFTLFVAIYAAVFVATDGLYGLGRYAFELWRVNVIAIVAVFIGCYLGRRLRAWCQIFLSARAG